VGRVWFSACAVMTVLAGAAVRAAPGDARAQVPPVPATMRAAAFDKGGGPEVLSIHTLPVPGVGPGQVLIAVQAAGIGAWEAQMRQDPGEHARFPQVLGGDGSGIVAAVGPGVRGFKPGDRVYGTGNGFYAEYVSVRAENIAHVPAGMTPAEAGVLAISGLSALQGIDDVLQLKVGQTVIIHGAAGAVGALALQFAKLRGARVLASVSSTEGAALVKRLGADVVVNTQNEDIGAAAGRFAPQGVDAVLALAGGEGLEHCIDALRSDGRGRVAYLYGMQPAPRPRFGARITLYSFVDGRQEIARLNQAVVAAKLQVPIAAEFALADAAQAHRRLEAGHLLGKIVLRVR